MPLEELLALYGYGGENQENESPVEDDLEQETMEEQESETDPPDQPSKLRTLYDPIPENEQDASRLLRCKCKQISKHVLFKINNLLHFFCMENL